MDIIKKTKTKKTMVVKIKDINEIMTSTGNPMIRIRCEDLNGQTVWFSNWRSVWDALKVDIKNINKDDKLLVSYTERIYDNGATFNNFIDIAPMTQSQPSETDELPF